MSALQKGIKIGKPILAVSAGQWMIERDFAATLWT